MVGGVRERATVYQCSVSITPMSSPVVCVEKFSYPIPVDPPNVPFGKFLGTILEMVQETSAYPIKLG